MVINLNYCKRLTSGQPRGFTLVELLVSMSIFVTIGVLTLGIFTQSLRSQRKSLVKAQIQRESQLIMETMTKKIRTSIVDYDEYVGPINNPASTLYLRDANNDSVAFRKSQNNALEVSFNGGSFKQFTAQSVLITNLDFFIEPVADPFVKRGYLPSDQPRVIISVVFASADPITPSSVLVEQLVPQRSAGF